MSIIEDFSDECPKWTAELDEIFGPPMKKDKKTVKRIKLQDYSFQDAQVYQGYNLNFLKNPIDITVVDPIKLIKTKFNYKIEKLADQDHKQINRILANVNGQLRIQNANIFLNGKDTQFLTDSYPGIPTTFLEDQKWKVKITIQGFKTGSSDKPTPIWKMTQAQLCVID